jgi:hypothetical protein
MAEEVFVLDLPIVVGNTKQTWQNLIALRLELMANPKPKYAVHGHAYDWPGLYAVITKMIDDLQRQLCQLEQYEFVGIGR